MLPDHVMRDLRYIELFASRHMRNTRIGAYTSRLRGSGFDFDQHRAYHPGDDVRRIDWNVTARLNAPFLRETHADRELDVLVAIDLSPSMGFGTVDRSKRDVMLSLAASLVFSALADQINVGFLAFNDRVISYHRPRRERARVWSVLEELWSVHQQAAQTSILRAARFLTERLRKTSLVFVISDFISDEDLAAAPELKMLALRHDVVAVVLEDPAEEALPRGTHVMAVRDLESGAYRRVGLGPGLRRRYAEFVRQRRESLVDAFHRIPVDHVFLRSDRNAVEPLMRLFASRRRR